jgi:hypothetical protein
VYLAYLLLLYLAADHIKEEEHWSRLVYIAGNLGSLVSAAVGWLFGREVHRAAFQQATDEADRARGDAAAAKRDADAGRALALAIKGDTEPSALKGMAEQFLTSSSSTPSAPPDGTEANGAPR